MLNIEKTGCFVSKKRPILCKELLNKVAILSQNRQQKRHFPELAEGKMIRNFC
jgi:hypothetical protein